MSIFKYYRSGLYEADIHFNGKKVFHRFKDIYSNKWGDLEELSKSHGYEIDLLALSPLLDELMTINWDQKDSVTVSNGYRYNKYLNINGAWIWALRDVQSPVDVIVQDKEIIGFVSMSRGSSSILVKAGCEGSTPLNMWIESIVSEGGNPVKHMGKFMVEMRDGIRLATDVWLPANLEDAHTIPTVLVRTPYGRLLQAEREMRFVKRGYALVVQDVRGRDDSEGKWIPNIFEIDDGDDTLNWIGNQQWSNGKVGMIGGSYLGYVQWAAAASGNQHLKAIVSLVTAGSGFFDVPRRGGTILSGMLAWAFMMSDKTINRDALNRDDWDEVLKIRPLRDIPKRALGKEVEFWNTWMLNNPNNDFWKKMDWSLYGEKINVPSLLVSGWFDDNGMGTTEAWDLNKKHNREHIKLLLGPWYHKANTTRDIHNIPFGDNAIRYDLDLLYLKWFDKYLKGINNGIENTPPVEYYLVGENQWKDASTWPPQEVKLVNLYVGSKEDAKSSKGDGYLSWQPQAQKEWDSYDFDPQDPTPHLIDMSENELTVPENYKDVELREDILVYTSNPLKDDLIIAGDIFAEIYASSSARDTDWVVRLTDVDEEGNSIRLSDGVLRARFRNSFDIEELLTPGEIVKYSLRMTKVANTFKKGHKIRVQITSGAKNFTFPNHNTGNDPATDIDYIVAKQRVYHSEKYPTHIKLPVAGGNISSN